jgi:hypothetical protein
VFFLKYPPAQGHTSPLLRVSTEGFGPFGERGTLAIFKTRAAAEQFVTENAFILEGLVKSFVIRDWNDTLLPE